jgi:hypothetical protein
VPGFPQPFRLAAGDLFGDGSEALAALYPQAGSLLFRLSVVRIALAAQAPSEAAPSWTATPVPEAQVPDLDLLAGGLVVADVTGNRLPEVWLAHAPQVGCLEWTGAGFAALTPWKFWQNKPVTMARLPGGGGPDQILAQGSYYSPEVGLGLIVAWWRDRMWGKARDVRADAFYSPGDRMAVADVNGDGRLELLVAADPRRRALPVQPFTVEAWDRPQPLAVLAGVFPEAVAVADLDGNGLPEVYLAGNGPAGGWLRVFAWNGATLAEVASAAYSEPVSDLAPASRGLRGRPALYVGLVRKAGEQDRLVLDVLQSAAP